MKSSALGYIDHMFWLFLDLMVLVVLHHYTNQIPYVGYMVKAVNICPIPPTIINQFGIFIFII